MIRTEVVKLSVIQAVAFRQKLTSGGAGITVLRYDTEQPGIASISKTSGDPILAANIQVDLYPVEAFKEAMELTSGMPYVKRGGVRLNKEEVEAVPPEESGETEEVPQEDVVVDSGDYQKLVAYYTDKNGKLSYDLLNRELIQFAHDNGTVCRMMADGADLEAIRSYIVCNQFRNAVRNPNLSEAEVMKMAELLDEVSPRSVFRELNEELRLWDVLVEPARKIRIGNKLFFDEDGPMVAEVIDNTTSRGRTLRFLYDCPHEEFKRELFALGAAPLPRYIVDKREAQPEDMENFQTIYAQTEGAVTAPASGLHFSRELMKRLEIRGVNFSYITVHCGLGSFDPIEVEDLTKHKMSSEQMMITGEACKIVNDTKMAGHNVCVVGISTLRAAETTVGTDGLLKEYTGWTNKFIFPPYDFGLANTLITNFYHPESTMMMATAAFAGYELTMEAYNLALTNNFMFGCYGDAMLVVND